MAASKCSVADFTLSDFIGAPFTPYDTEGNINYAVIKSCVDYFKKTHCTGLFVNGSLGEGLSLTAEERQRLAEAWREASRDSLQLVVQVGGNCLSECLQLSRHAESIGVDAIAAYSPSYYKPENEDILLEMMRKIAEAAPNTPFIFYDNMKRTGVTVNLESFLGKAIQKIPTLRGVKIGNPDVPTAYELLQMYRLKIHAGGDTMYLGMLAHGLTGIMPSPYLGNLMSDMKRAVDSADLATAREIQLMIQKINKVKARYGGGLNVCRVIFSLLTDIDVGQGRLPWQPLTTSQIEELRRDLTQLPFGSFAQPEV